MPTQMQERKAMAPCRTLIGIADAGLAARLAREIEGDRPPESVRIARSLSHLVDLMDEYSPRVILLDDHLVHGAPLMELIRQLTEGASVVLLAAPERQEEVIRLIAEGDLEFVARVEDFVPLAASLVERRLRWAARSESSLGAPWAGMPEDIAEIFRHEINNPLTGILGNAELLLAHGARMPAMDMQRLQTVVELAVRLRETIRRLSDAWESRAQSARAS
ncbi:MAG: histidine kinase dimerization/phospho-acceptor domain-containing protein [Candidatus Acidiferrales bacterium]